MNFKLALLAALLLLASAYTEENHVLVLTDDDFPNILAEFDYILIEFYAPWCGHCKKLAPIYDEIAADLHNSGSVVRLAKIDCDSYSKAKSSYQVQGFPTLIFFHKGEQIKYSGQRSKQVLINWLTKKTQDAVIATTSDQLQSIASNGKVNIVFHGDINSEAGAVIGSIAKADDYNTYYHVADSTKEAGSVEIHRPFGDVVSYPQADGNLKEWIHQHQRPNVYIFDDRTIGEIFSERQPGLVLFGSATEASLATATFQQAASSWRSQGHSLIFTQIPATNEHYKNLADYIKINPAAVPIVYISTGEKAKYVLAGNASDLRVEQIIGFLNSVNNKSAKRYNLDENVKVEVAETDQEL